MRTDLGRVRGAVLVTVCALALLLPAVAYAKQYEISAISIGAAVDPNGDLRVTEDRTVKFQGQFSWVEWNLAKKGSEGIEVLGVSSMQGGVEQPYNKVEGEAQDSGTYSVTDNGDSITVRVAIDVADTTLPLRITYYAKAAAKRYLDSSELYWQFVGSGTAVPSGPVHIEVAPPSTLTKDQVKAWAHGPLNGTVTITQDGKVILDVPSLPANTFVETRILYPPEALPGAPVVSEAHGQVAQQQEAKLASAANAARTKAWLGIALAIGLSGLIALGGFAFALLAFLRHGREYRPTFTGGYVREDPRPDLAPAVIGALWRFDKVTEADVAATLMDLADKGVVAMRPTSEHSDGFLGIGAKDAQSFELGLNPKPAEGSIRATDQKLLTLLFTDIGDGAMVRLEQIKSYAKEHPKEFTDKMQSWKDSCSAAADALGLFEGPSWSWQIGMFVLAACVAAVCFFAAVWGGTGWPICFGIPSAVAISVFGLYMLRRSPEGNDLYAQYKGLHDFLRDFSRLSEAPPQSVVLWNRFLVLAVVFGIAKEVIDELRVKMPDVVGDPAFQTTYWWVYSGTSNVSPASWLQSGFASATQIATSAQSSASGGGGGFSGGGGGGGGGGGFSAG